MMIELLFTISSFFLFIVIFYYFYHNPNYNNRSLPRAGGALPIIGHLHLFAGKQLLHKTLAAMADKYGPVFTVKLGSQENMVVSSWETAKECFTTLDKVFADRPNLTATRLLGFDGAMFGLAPYGPYWRQMRKIATLELLSHRRIDLMSHIRASELQTSLKKLYDLWVVDGSRVRVRTVDMKVWFDDLTMNTFVRMVGGERKDGDSERRGEVRELMRDYFHCFGVFVLSDAIPLLAWLDLQGHERSMKRKAKAVDDLVGEWLAEHKEKRETTKYKSTVVDDDEEEEEDFMDAMLTVMEDADFPQFEADTITKATCLNMVLAGSDATMVTLTWALSLLLNNPHTLKKAREEVDAHISKDRHVNDSDIKNLVYLEAVVKETLRLYPATPMIGLHSSSEDCTLSTGHHIPSGTRLLVNIWKIQRDEKLWEEPLEFRPERFLTSHKDLDMRGGHNFEFTPFGSGRRSCPGSSLALQIVHSTLASLLHCYEFSRASDAEIDMSESYGLINLKATPLEVYITPRMHPHIFVIGL
ncbi:hypothetical protein C2S51_006446 [Perilla frutescens var. frutescens]|nr:hypothetical protein C2S51_006446 [Perilla frutescens var. frutescens]